MTRVAVVGSGLAGLACARSLRQRGLRPLLIAPASETRNRGETLSFRARSGLEVLGWMPLLDAASALACEGRYSVWGNAALRRDDGLAAGDGGWHVDRWELETRMAKALAVDGVDRLVASVRTVTPIANGVAIECADGTRHSAEIVVDCSGRAAVSVGNGRLARLDRLVCCYAIFALGDDVDVAAATLVEAVADGWWYMAALPRRRVMIGYFTDSDLLLPGLSRDARCWALLASKTLAISRRLDSLGIDPAQVTPQFAAASTVTATAIVECRILRAGDAASAFDPLAANGLATALWSGRQAAEGVAGLLAGDSAPAARYERSFLEGIATHLLGQRALYAAERRFRTAPFWRRRTQFAAPVV